MHDRHIDPNSECVPNSSLRLRGTADSATIPITTVDVVDHSRATDALERALDQAACGTEQSQSLHTNFGDNWVQRALQQLEDRALSVTVTDYRLIGWGRHDPIPRGWGCYRINHLASGQWLEMVASRSVRSSASRARAVMNNMTTLLETLLGVPDPAEASENTRDETAERISERPTEPGWPPGEEPSDDAWWQETPAAARAEKRSAMASTAA